MGYQVYGRKIKKNYTSFFNLLHNYVRVGVYQMKKFTNNFVNMLDIIKKINLILQPLKVNFIFLSLIFVWAIWFMHGATELYIALKLFLIGAFRLQVPFAGILFDFYQSQRKDITSCFFDVFFWT